MNLKINGDNKWLPETEKLDLFSLFYFDYRNTIPTNILFNSSKSGNYITVEISSNELFPNTLKGKITNTTNSSNTFNIPFYSQLYCDITHFKSQKQFRVKTNVKMHWEYYINANQTKISNIALVVDELNFDVADFFPNSCYDVVLSGETYLADSSLVTSTANHISIKAAMLMSSKLISCSDSIEVGNGINLNISYISTKTYLSKSEGKAYIAQVMKDVSSKASCSSSLQNYMCGPNIYAPDFTSGLLIMQAEDKNGDLAPFNVTIFDSGKSEDPIIENVYLMLAIKSNDVENAKRNTLYIFQTLSSSTTLFNYFRTGVSGTYPTGSLYDKLAIGAVSSSAVKYSIRKIEG